MVIVMVKVMVKVVQVMVLRGEREEQGRRLQEISQELDSSKAVSTAYKRTTIEKSYQQFHQACITISSI